MEASITFKKVGQLVNGKTVLAGLSFGIERNSTVAIIGDNEDSGITEFLRIIAGLVPPQYGSLFINGLDSIKRNLDIRKYLGYVPFQNDMDPWLTAEQNIKFINGLYRNEIESTDSNYAEYVDALDVKEKIKKPVNQLSPGVLRKLTLLRELLRNPEILVIDHPTAFMNAKDKVLTLELLKSLKGKKTIIYSSSSLNTIENFHDRILVFHNGGINLDDKVENMLNNWIGKYQYSIKFEKLMATVVREVEQIPDVLSLQKENNTLIFNCEKRSVFLEVLSKLAGVTIIDIKFKKFNLKDLLAARFSEERIV